MSAQPACPLVEVMGGDKRCAGARECWVYSGAPYVSTLSSPSNRFTLVCPGSSPLFYSFFAADLDNYILRTNNNNIERGHER